MELKQFKEQLFVEGEKKGFSNVELYYEKTDKLSCDVYDVKSMDMNPPRLKVPPLEDCLKGKRVMPIQKN